MRDRLTKKDLLGGRFRDGVFSEADGTSLWIAALPPGGIFGEHTGAELYQAALKLVAETDPQAVPARDDGGGDGPVATAVIARQAVERDILWVTISCAAVVALSILLYFRRVRSVPLIGIPAVMGTVMAFAVAKLAFGYVNSSTAFLGSIILGNGINYAIILLARYQEERSSGVAAAEALERAVGGVATGTGVAAICASAAYATLTLTSFRGFFQFGVMGACGVLFCWMATFTVMPALFFRLDRRAPVVAGGAPASLAVVARLVARRPRPILVISALVTALSAYGLLHFTRAPFEYDFRKLNVRTAHNSQNDRFTQDQDRLFGRWPQPYIVLADRPEDVEPIRAAIRKQDEAFPGPPLIGQIVTLHDVLPGLPEAQQRKLALVAQIRKLVHDPALESVSEEDRKKIQSIDPPDDLRVVSIDDLPPLARRPFTERDGTGRQGGPGLLRRVRHLGLERQGPHAHRLGAAGDPPARRPHPADLGERGGVLGHDPLDPARREDRHRGLAGRGGAAGVPVHAPHARGGHGHQQPAGRGAVDDRRRRLGRGEDHLPQLHRPAHHLRHRRRVRPQRRSPATSRARTWCRRSPRRAARWRCARGPPSSATARCWRRATGPCRGSGPWPSWARWPA
jgi:hypothetical protein